MIKHGLSYTDHWGYFVPCHLQVQVNERDLHECFSGWESNSTKFGFGWLQVSTINEGKVFTMLLFCIKIMKFSAASVGQSNTAQP